MKSCGDRSGFVIGHECSGVKTHFCCLTWALTSWECEGCQFILWSWRHNFLLERNHNWWALKVLIPKRCLKTANIDAYISELSNSAIVAVCWSFMSLESYNNAASGNLKAGFLHKSHYWVRIWEFVHCNSSGVCRSWSKGHCLFSLQNSRMKKAERDTLRLQA